MNAVPQATVPVFENNNISFVINPGLETGKWKHINEERLVFQEYL